MSLIGFTLTGGVTPGPNNIILMGQGLRFGFRKCLPYIAGVAAGWTLILSAAVLGLGALIVSAPILLNVITIIGALWLAYLAWGFLRAGLVTQTAGKDSGQPRQDDITKPLGFWHAFGLQWVNPKGLIFALGAAAGYTSLHENLWVRFAVILSAFLLSGLIGNALWAAMGSAIHRHLSGGKWANTLNIFMGAIILATAIFILYAGFTH